MLVNTAINLWLKNPSHPPLWKCLLVAWVMKEFEPKKTIYGSLEQEEELGSDVCLYDLTKFTITQSPTD